MTTVERQVHGYRQGHQLLAASVQLSKEDQSTIDRLSDVAGPLRPRERFEPYLTAYSLPSGEHYVLARTWQDLTVTRAGCVRTVSLIIKADDWAAAESLSPYLDLLDLDHLPEDVDAKSTPVPATSVRPLPPALEFEGSELLEALFLEDQRPVVVFDVPSPEIIVVRLLTALWPGMRRRFAVSTFALSPRKIGGRDFNLVFAPKDARAKFADWNGRRIDGRSTSAARHRWTGRIINRVFEAPRPTLLSSSEVDLVGGDNVDNGAVLRIALLWDELIAKLQTTPTAALGLLDIANSGKVRDGVAMQTLEPFLAGAVRLAQVSLPEGDAWEFLGAIARKMQGRSMSNGFDAVRAAVGDLAGRSPEGAIALLSQPDERGVARQFVPVIASGISDAFTDRAERALLSAPGLVLGTLVAESPRLAERVANDHPLLARVDEVLPKLDRSLAHAVGEELLPWLVQDWQLPAAEPILSRLDGDQLAAHIRHLSSANDFAAPAMAELCISLARGIGVKQAIMSALSEVRASARRDALLTRALDPSLDDAVWVLRESGLPAEVVATMIVDVLRRADDPQLGAIIGDGRIGTEVMAIVEHFAPDLLRRILFGDGMPLDAFVRVATAVFASAMGDDKVKVAKRTLQRCLGSHFGVDEIAFLVTMLSGVGEGLDGAWAARLGLARGVQASVASRNIVAFRKATQPARLRVVWSVNEVAEVLQGRQAFDLDEAAADACAYLLFESEKVTPRAALSAAGHLLPMLMRQRKDPVSLMIAATFPLIYRELRKKDDLPDLLKFVPFFDWDRCKAARQELVSAFLSSNWAPGDLALTACRCDDVGRILRRTAKAHGGEPYLGHISADLGRLPDGCRKPVEKTIAAIRSDRTSKYDWLD